MKQDIQRIMLAAAKPLFLIFILYILKIMEVGMDWDFSRLGVYPMEKRGLVGILTHPLIHSGFSHLLANTIPLFFLSWCLFYFYRGIAGKIFILIWFGGGLLTFLIGKPGWHIGASGLIYGLAFFLFFSGILRKYVPLIAISLLVTFLYGGIIWHMFPYFSPTNMSWEGHLSGGIMGTLCAFVFVNHGPQRPGTFCGRNGRGRKYRRRNNSSSRRRRNVINANSCHHIGTLVTSKWHDCRQRHVTVVPTRWHIRYNSFQFNKKIKTDATPQSITLYWL